LTERVARGRFGRRAVIAVGLVAVVFAVLVTAALARGKPGDPKPIPGGFSIPPAFFFHVMPPSLPFEMSTIGDFNGTIGAAEIQGTAHGSDGTAYAFDVDMRFMQGAYIDAAGKLQHGSFAFI
jgi:hypothetical protein